MGCGVSAKRRALPIKDVMNMDLCNLEEIKKLLSKHGFQFSKSMGQNFLIESWVPRETAHASGAGPGIGVLEIGPGIGPLTKELSALGEKVVAVELDRSLLPILEETLEDCGNVKVVSGDILKLDLKELCQREMPGKPLVVCANLPYNITTPVITALVESRLFTAITVMIQKEVALRIAAKPGTSDYGAFSLYCQYHADCKVLYDVPPDCFHPAPKVWSSVIRMELREPPAEVEDPDLFFRVIKASFAQRRKTLQNGLLAAFGGQYTKEELGEILESCGLSKSIRGEQLGIPQFAILAKKLKNQP